MLDLLLTMESNKMRNKSYVYYCEKQQMICLFFVITRTHVHAYNVPLDHASYAYERRRCVSIVMVPGAQGDFHCVIVFGPSRDRFLAVAVRDTLIECTSCHPLPGGKVGRTTDSCMQSAHLRPRRCAELLTR
jgi:hypothetical protein